MAKSDAFPVKTDLQYNGLKNTPDHQVAGRTPVRLRYVIKQADDFAASSSQAERRRPKRVTILAALWASRHGRAERGSDIDI